MNDEIKEFIEFRADEDGTYFYYIDKNGDEQWSYNLDNLKDYITNLQQENEELNKMCELYSKSLYCAELTDYKSRIEKAVEYIKEHIQKYDIDGSIGDFDEFDMLTKPNYLLNILQGNLNDE